MGWVNPRAGLGWVGLGRDFAVFDGLGWVEYIKSTIYFDDYTTHNCIPVESLGSSGKVGHTITDVSSRLPTAKVDSMKLIRRVMRAGMLSQ